MSFRTTLLQNRIKKAKNILPDFEISKDEVRSWIRPLVFALIAVVVGIVGGVAAVALPNPLIGVGAAVGATVAVMMLVSPIFTLSVVVIVGCLLPFGVVPIKLGLTFTFLEASLLVLFGLWLVRVAVGVKGQETLVTVPFGWAVWLFVGLCLFTFGLGWDTSHDTETIHNFAKLLLSVLSFFAVINLVRTQSALETMLRVLILAGSGAALISLILYRLPFSLQERLLLALRPLGYPVDRVLRFVEDDMLKPQRATGTSVDPNSFAGMLVLIFAIIFTQLLAGKPIFGRWKLAAMLAVTGLAMFLTYSRSAILLGVAATILFLALIKYRKIWFYLVPGIGLVLLILPQTPLWSRFAGGFALSDPATIMRLNEYKNAIDIVQHYPLFGVGFGHAPVIDLTTGVSSVYLSVAERMGLVGLSSFLLVMLMFFIYVIASLKHLKNVRQSGILLGFAAGIAGALATGTLDYYFFDIRFPHMAALFWIAMGLAVVQVNVAMSVQADTKVSNQTK